MTDSTPPPDDPIGSDLRELLAQTAPAEPSAVAWERVHQAVEGHLRAPGPSTRTIGLALAASVLLAVGVIVATNRNLPDPEPVAVLSESADEPLVMAGDDDVEVHRVRGNWRAVVGSSPIPNAFAWAGPKDVWLWTALPDEMHGFEPRTADVAGAMPLIYADDFNN
jgi:hypothetical protein